MLFCETSAQHWWRKQYIFQPRAVTDTWGCVFGCFPPKNHVEDASISEGADVCEAFQFIEVFRSEETQNAVC